MDVEIISSQIIKPSCPTTHPRYYKLSILDQFVPPEYIPMVLFYSGDPNTQAITDITHQRMKQLKESLSQSYTINCNDEGVHFTEAKVSCSLSEFFNQPNLPSLLYKLIPNQALNEVSTEGYTTMVKVTCFASGSMVIGTLVSHMVTDGAGASFFLNSWGSNSLIGESQHELEFPNFDTPFPRNNVCNQDTNVTAFKENFLNEGRLATRRFLFDAKAISRLKTQGSSLTVKNPTRVEVVSSFLCKCVAKASKAKSGLERSTLVTHALNMRRKASPNFSNSCMGKFTWVVTALTSANDELAEMVNKFREAVNSINSDFVKNFQGEGGFVKYCETAKHLIETASDSARMSADGVNYLNYSSWCNFGLYDVDFGWGKPIWVSCIPECDDILCHINGYTLGKRN
ncbi:hypothetical protein Fmac_027555 [Flemingia macrophylla]|uniref:Uncharacterized protein n=1 Tax=Flemingia macrophylla TaxID=520843 RepID=A0ABD1LI74_9FABA